MATTMTKTARREQLAELRRRADLAAGVRVCTLQDGSEVRLIDRSAYEPLSFAVHNAAMPLEASGQPLVAVTVAGTPTSVAIAYPAWGHVRLEHHSGAGGGMLDWACTSPHACDELADAAGIDRPDVTVDAYRPDRVGPDSSGLFDPRGTDPWGRLTWRLEPLVDAVADGRVDAGSAIATAGALRGELTPLIEHALMSSASEEARAYGQALLDKRMALEHCREMTAALDEAKRRVREASDEFDIASVAVYRARVAHQQAARSSEEEAA